jgi:hypothetical protein
VEFNTAGSFVVLVTALVRIVLVTVRVAPW